MNEQLPAHLTAEAITEMKSAMRHMVGLGLMIANLEHPLVSERSNEHFRQMTTAMDRSLTLWDEMTASTEEPSPFEIQTATAMANLAIANGEVALLLMTA